MKIVDDVMRSAQKSIDTFMNFESDKKLKIIASVALVALGVSLIVKYPILFVITATVGAAFYYCSRERSALDKISDWVESTVQNFRVN